MISGKFLMIVMLWTWAVALLVAAACDGAPGEGGPAGDSDKDSKGGSVAAPTATIAPTATATPTATDTPTPSPVLRESPTATAQATPTSTAVPTPTATATPAPPVGETPVVVNIGPNVGDLAPGFTLPAASGPEQSLESYRGKSNLLVVFYRAFW